MHSGCGNSALEKLLNQLPDTYFSLWKGRKSWLVPSNRVTKLIAAFNQYAPPPKPPMPPKDQVEKALREARMPAGYTSEIREDAILLKGPYLPTLIGALRGIEGKWNRDDKYWKIPLHRSFELVELLRRSAPTITQIDTARSELAAVNAPEGYSVAVRDDGIYVGVSSLDPLAPKFKLLGARWDQPSGRWYFTPERAQALREYFQALAGSSAKAKEILASTPMPNGYSWEVSPVCILVQGPKSEALRKRFHKLNGKWNAADQKWAFLLEEVSPLAKVLQAFARH